MYTVEQILCSKLPLIAIDLSDDDDGGGGGWIDALDAIQTRKTPRNYSRLDCAEQHSDHFCLAGR
jgi:hypothetical protein